MRTTCGTILAAAGLSLTTNAAGIATDALVTVDVTNAVRAVKPMHAVNNGPTVKKPKGDQKCGNFEDYKAARIPFARTHDSINCVAGGAHTCDISAVFPDFDPAETDMLMFYDAMVGSGMNNMFSKPTLQPLKGYYPFYAWSKLVDCGTQVACTVREGRREESDANTGTAFKSENGKPVGSFRGVAAKGEDGSGALIVARYSEDNNVTDTAKVMVSVPGVSLAKARCHLTDSVRTYTEVPLDLQGDGTALIRMQPNSFAVVEW